MAALVKQLLSANTVTVFSKTYCPYCTRVKGLFAGLDGDFSIKTIELDESPDGPALEKELNKMTGRTSVPKVFIRGEFIGGCDDTVALQSTGKLEAKIAGANL